jgi:dUTP pyrophosphatase
MLVLLDILAEYFLTFPGIRIIITSFAKGGNKYGMTKKQGVLTRLDILRMQDNQPPLIADAVDLDEQIQPNGIDLTVREVAYFSSRGKITGSNQGRELSALTRLEFGVDGGLDLLPGPYLVTFNEVVALPDYVMALGRPRSSLNRCGVSMHSAVWDAGYSGRSQSLLVVYNPHGFRLQRNARVMQLVFFYTSGGVDKGYSGKYQNENL